MVACNAEVQLLEVGWGGVWPGTHPWLRATAKLTHPPIRPVDIPGLGQ